MRPALINLDFLVGLVKHCLCVHRSVVSLSGMGKLIKQIKMSSSTAFSTFVNAVDTVRFAYLHRIANYVFIEFDLIPFCFVINRPVARNLIYDSSK